MSLFIVIQVSFFNIFLREEGTIPYSPELSVSLENVVNYNQSIFNVRGIHTAPAGLESTSLILVYGIGMNILNYGNL